MYNTDDDMSDYEYSNSFQTRNDLVKHSDEQGFHSDWNDNIDEDMSGKTNSNLDYYYNSYSNYYIHEEMIKDKIRTESYKIAIESNKEIFKNKIVLDVGCGSGILSIFAAKAGAFHVYAIEKADIAHYAREIVKQNFLSHRITIINSAVEEAVLPVDKVDIIISEWMGYFLLYESMLDTVIYARDKWLKKDGFIFPDKAVINMAAIEDANYKDQKINFWEDIYGINMSIFKNYSLSEPLIDYCDKKAINSNVCKIFEIDLYTVKTNDLDFSSAYELKFIRNDWVHALVTWFDIFFDKVDNKVCFTTGPFNTGTHWKQVVFYTKKDFPVYKGDILKGSIAVRKSISNFRSLDVKISYHHNEMHFSQLYKIK